MPGAAARMGVRAAQLVAVAALPILESGPALSVGRPGREALYFRSWSRIVKVEVELQRVFATAELDAKASAGARAGRAVHAPAYGVGMVDAQVQRASAEPGGAAGVHAAAQVGVAGAGQPLPFAAQLQRAFGKHDLSGVKAHADAPAARGAAAMGALAFTRGEHVAFGVQPSLRLAAHEAAHVVQQRAGLRLPGGVGRADDAHERQADAVAERVVAGQSAEALLGPVAGSGAPGPVVQRYQVLPSDHLYAAMPASRPWFGYPYAVVRDTYLVAQTHRAGVTGVHDFLDANASNSAWTTTAGHGFALRVSDDTEMAVEDSDLTDRQPKVFFATPAVIATSNAALTRAGSAFQLLGDAGSPVTILTGWYSQKTLNRVTPQYNGGSADLAPQNCNAIAAAVMGEDAEAVGRDGGEKALGVAKAMAPEEAADFDRWLRNARDPRSEAEVFNALAEAYIEAQTPWDLREHDANEYAVPSVGEAYMIGSVGTGDDPLHPGRVRDYASGQIRNLSWPYHFGGVVAVSGSDRITLENYARGDMRANGADPRWYFQMYGSGGGQTFHDFHEGKQEYANPVTIGLAKPPPRGR